MDTLFTIFLAFILLIVVILIVIGLPAVTFWAIEVLFNYRIEFTISTLLAFWILFLVLKLAS